MKHEKWVIFKNTLNQITKNTIPIYFRAWIFTPPMLFENIKNYINEKISQSNKYSSSLEHFKQNLKFIIYRFEKDPLIIEDIVPEFSTDKISNITNKMLETLKNIEEIIEKAPKDNFDWKKIKKEIDKIKKLQITNYKLLYINSLYSKLKSFNKNDEIKLLDKTIESVQKHIYSWLGALIAYGYSEEHICLSFQNVSSSNYKDFWKELLPLQTKHKDRFYKVFVPCKTEKPADSSLFKFIINNFNELNKKVSIINKKQLQDDLWKKTIRNKNEVIKFLTLNPHHYFYKVKIKAKDEYKAANNALKLVLPKHTASLRLNTNDFLPDKSTGILSLRLVLDDDKSFEKYIEKPFSNISLGFEKDYSTLAVYKVKAFKRNCIFGWMPHWFKNDLDSIFINKFRHDMSDQEEAITSTSSILLERTTALFNKISSKDKSEKINLHILIINLAILEIKNEWLFKDLCFPGNKKFLIKKFKDANVNLDYKSEDFLVEFISKKCKLRFKQNESWEKYMYLSKFNENIILDEKMLNLSLLFMKNNSIISRNQYQHKGKKLNYFSLISAETLDSILMHAVNKVIQKKITNIEEYNNIIKMHKENFENITKRQESNYKKNFNFIKNML